MCHCQVLDERVHSGDASGVVPSSFRIQRLLLDRIDNPNTGEVVEDFQVNIPREDIYKLKRQLKIQCPIKLTISGLTHLKCFLIVLQEKCINLSSIPLMNTLKQQYPKAQFIVTGILGPNSNAHGLNEFLHIPFTKSLISCIRNFVTRLQIHLKK
ncbi:unnamed protein product (macronuclear) [Paramecium tetraurelia]|uniref:Peptidase M20 dimerisation domain-containing protein n=1 Tax=Paramecium tetraurelia TaxID=5888 RepID=A0CK37_PARTE|nr:uncharacterized protein GSPATT00000867001 [Paramecium tetraurelia]CAK71154.1 unnamed protein product [Paramecium tetraurelia]|eukprot:XP_001438551.1 hypothetical protein (macronuclear) [Paramecium tetraurelia strain d4-2]